MRLFARMAMALLATTGLAAAPQRHAKSPNDIICRDVPMSGSRLDANRVCMTRLQWEDRQHVDREMTDKAQRQQVNAH